MCAVPKDTRRGHQLQVAVSHSTWVMETEPEFSPEGRAASVLNSEPSQQPLRHTALVPSSCTGFFFFYYLFCFVTSGWNVKETGTWKIGGKIINNCPLFSPSNLLGPQTDRS